MTRKVDFKDEEDLIHAQHEAEESFIAAAFADPEYAVQNFPWIRPEWFRDPRRAAFWKNLLAGMDSLDAANAVDHSMVGDVSKWVQRTVSLAYIDDYAATIRDLNQRKTALRGATELAKRVFQQPIQDILTTLTKIIQDVEDAIPPPPLEGLDQLQAEFAAYVNTPKKGIPTGISPLDRLIGTLVRKAVYIVSARTSVGKTALATQIARNAAANNFKVIYFTLEMGRRQLWERWSCGMAGIEPRVLQADRLPEPEKQRIIKYGDDLRKRYGDKLLIFDNVFTVDEMHRICAVEQPDLVVVDYLDKIWWRHNDQETIWRGKALSYLDTFVAKRLNCALIMVHQLSRHLEHRADKRPNLADLRWDGSIEMYADVVIALHRKDYHDKDEQTPGGVSITDLMILKNRIGGPIGDAKIGYDLAHQWFNPIQSITPLAVPIS